MLIECAIGDALGAGYEFASEHFIKSHEKDLINYHQNPKHSTLIPGKYTDDTQMSIAIALSCLNQQFDKKQITQNFIDQFFIDMRYGYAGGFYDFLLTVKNADDFLNRIKPGSTKAGAAMRVGPIGLLPDIEKVKEVTTTQAKITHDTPEGINSALLVSLSVHYFYHQNGKPAGLQTFLKKHVNEGLQAISSLEQRHIGGGYGCVKPAIEAIIKHDNYVDIAKVIINKAGDTDTALAIAYTIASVCPLIKNNLPKRLYDGLENNEFGRDYLVNLDQKLLKAFPHTEFKKSSTPQHK